METADWWIPAVVGVSEWGANHLVHSLRVSSSLKIREWLFWQVAKKIGYLVKNPGGFRLREVAGPV